jgi:hypothetical protein
MAAHESDIQQLRTQLQASRWQLHDSLQQLEERFNVPQRIKNQVAEHPLKWAALAVGAGAVAASVVPLVLRRGRNQWLRSLLAPALRIAFVSALPKLMPKWSQAKAADLLDPKAT